MYKKLYITIFLMSEIWFIGCASINAMGNKPLVDSRIQLAEQIKLADKVSGVEQNIKELKVKIETQANAIAGVNNVVSRVQSDVKSGRDTIQTNTNDSEIMKQYITALKDNAKEQGKLYQRVIMGLIAQMGILISLLGWCLKFLLKADERRDIREEKKERINEKNVSVS